MKAVVFRGIGDIALETVPDPRIKDPNDVIVKITASAICGTDLHMIRGTMPGRGPVSVGPLAGTSLGGPQESGVSDGLQAQYARARWPTRASCPILAVDRTSTRLEREGVPPARRAGGLRRRPDGRRRRRGRRRAARRR